MLFGLAALASRPASLHQALDRDPGTYLTVGDAILHGGTPYVDAADNKGPVTYLLFAAIRLASGTSAVRVRLILLLFTAIAAVAVARYVSRHSGRAAGVASGLVLATLGSTILWDGANPNTEQFAVAPMAGAWCAASRPGSRSAWLSGGLVAIAVLMNPGFVVIVPVIALQLWWARRPTGARARLLAAVGGGVMVAIPIFAWLALSGAMHDFEIQVLAGGGNSVLSHATINRLSVHELLDFPARMLWFIGFVGALLAGLRFHDLRRPAIAAIAWIILMWARVKANGYEFPHHYYPVIPGIAVGIGLGLASVRRMAGLAPTAVAALLLVLPAWQYVIHPQVNELQVAPAARTLREYGVDFSRAYPVASFVGAHTSAHASIFVAAHEPEVYWLANRRPATRFTTDYPVLRHPPYAGERQAELERNPPDALVELFGRRDDQVVVWLMSHVRYRLAYTSGASKVWLRQEESAHA